jgi:hypothetical protein
MPSTISPQTKQTSWQFPDVFIAADAQLGFNRKDKLTAFTLLSNGTKTLMTPQLVAHLNGPDGTVQQIGIPVKPLQPLETRIIELSRLLAAEATQTDISHLALTINHAGTPGDLGIVVFSVGQSKDFVFRSEGTVSFSTAMDYVYWDISGNLISLLSVQNTGANELKARATLTYSTSSGTGAYSLPLISLPGNGSRILNLNQAILANIPDEHGNTIPSGTAFGTLKIETEDKKK